MWCSRGWPAAPMSLRHELRSAPDERGIICQTLTETLSLSRWRRCWRHPRGLWSRRAGRLRTGVFRLLEYAHLNTPLLVFAFSVSVLTGAVCGIVPAWRAYRRDPGAALQESTRASVGGRRAERSRDILVGVEVALATVLLASAGLLLHSFVKLMQADRGYDVQRVLAVDLSLFGQRYSSASARGAFYSELLDHVRSLPGVERAARHQPLASHRRQGCQADDFPLDRYRLPEPRVGPTGRPGSQCDRWLLCRQCIRCEPAGSCTGDEPQLVAVISESLANRMWPGESLTAIVGRQLRQGDVSGVLVTVVGVVAEEHPGDLGHEPPLRSIAHTRSGRAGR